MKVNYIDVKTTLWQRIHFKEEMDIEDIKHYVKNHDLNAMWDDDLVDEYENILETEEYNYDSIEYLDDSDVYRKVKLNGEQ